MNDVQILYLTTLKRMEDIYIDQFHILTPIQIYRLIRNKKKMIFNSNNINFYREGSSNKLIKNLL